MSDVTFPLLEEETPQRPGILRPALLLSIPLGMAFFLFADPFLSPPDCLSYWAWGESIATDLDLAFSDEYAKGEMPLLYVYETAAGKLSNDWPMGSGLALIPVVLAGKWVSHAWVILWIAGALIAWRRAAPFGGAAGNAGLIACVAGTPLLFYSFFGPFFSHGVSFALTTLFLLTWDRTRADRSAWEWFLLGLLLGLAGMTRPQNLLLGAVLAAEGRGLSRAVRRLPTFPVYAGAGLLLGFLPQLLGYWGTYGSPLALPKLEEMHWLRPAIGKVLFSDFHGVLPWTPIYAAGFAGLAMLWLRDRVLAGGLLLVLLLQLYVNAANAVWWSGGSFGNRRLADSAIVVAYGTASLWGHRPNRGWKWFVGALVGYCVFWSVWLVLAERRLIVPLSRYVPFWRAPFFYSLIAVWTEPAATVRSLVRHSFTGTDLIGRLTGAVMLMAGVPALVALSARLNRASMRSLSIAVCSLAAAAVLLTAVSALRTGPLPEEATPPNLGTEPGVLWDNYIEVGYYHLVHQDWIEMEEAGRGAVEIAPERGAGWWILGVALLQQERHVSARQAFTRAIELQPNHPYAPDVLRRYPDLATPETDRGM